MENFVVLTGKTLAYTINNRYFIAINWRNPRIAGLPDRKDGVCMKKRSILRRGGLLLLVLGLTLLFATGLTADAAVTQTRTEGIDAFPESYQPYLKALQAEHPTWQFVAFDTGLTWDEVLDGETRVVSNNLVLLSTKTSWKSLAPGSFNWETNTFAAFDGGKYNAASREIIAYYMDPRNALRNASDLRYVFQFEQLTFDPSTQTLAGVKQILKGTFMKEDTLLPGFTSAEEEGAMTYAQAFMAIAAELNVSPYHLAARVRQEQGTGGKSPLISGTYAGYEGYYNYFNVSANGSTQTDLYVNGLKRAQKEGWDTAYKALLGGAKLIADKYIAKGQDTLYLEKFDVAATGGLYDHQYMQNLRAAYSESLSVYNSYNNMGMLDGSFTFVIPVYRNMPETACPEPTADGNPNYKLQNLGVSGAVLDPEYNPDTLTYTATVGNDIHTVTVSALPYASTSKVSGTGSIGLAVGENVIPITVTAERGDTCTYTLRIIRLADGEIIIAMGTTTTGVNLRAEPNTNATVLTTVPQGRTVSILSDDGEWCQVIYGQYTGYLKKEYIHVYVPAKSLSLSQNAVSVIAGAPFTLQAITDPDPCDTVILWKTSNAAVATVSEGVITGHYTGTAIITAYTENGLSASCTVTVTEPVLFEGTVNVNSSLNVRDGPNSSGTSVIGKLKANARVEVVEVLTEWLRIRYPDSSSGVAWVSRQYIVSDPVDASGLTVTPESTVMTPGQTLTLGAALTPFYSTETLSWSSDNVTVATVKNGIVSAVSEGTAVITVTSSGGLTASCTITVEHGAQSVQLDRTEATVLIGQSVTLQATMQPADAQETLSWSTSNPAVATVQGGVVSAVSRGSAVITVTTTSGKTASCTVTVTLPPAESITLNQTALQLYPGKTATLEAAMLPLNAGDTLTWTSNNPAVATVQNGVVTAIFDGTAIITVTASPSGKTASCTVTVDGPADAVTLDKTALQLYQNGVAQLIATMTPTTSTDTLAWVSDNPSVATVQDGKISAVGEGTATITVTTSSGKSASCAVTVTFAEISVTLDQTEVTLAPGKTLTLVPTLAPNGITDTLTWTSSDPAVATVQNGVVTAVRKGSVTITVTTTSGKTASCAVTVEVPATDISLNKTDITMVMGESATLSATLVPADSTDELVWSSSDPAIFTVNNGKVTAVAVGTATLTVKARDGVQATCIVRVKSPVPDSVTSATFTVKSGYIRKISLGTTVEKLLAGLNEKQYCKVFTANGKAADGGALAATGMVVKLMDGDTVKASYTLVITGDADGDGQVTVNDYVALKGHILKKSNLDGAYAQAADADGDGSITVNDYVTVKGYILKKNSITAN